ncbi:VgrG protein [Minicystis rosea]|nr:VgrG protein [Minicystis rosea]
MSVAPFELHLPALHRTLDISSFQARESLSKLSRYDVRVTTPAAHPDMPAAWLGERASLMLLVNGEPARALHGLVVRVEALGPVAHERMGFQLTIAPTLWRLKRRRTRRIFQAQTTMQIAARLLDEHGVPFRSLVQRSLPERGMCVQYDETDYAFLVRLLAEEGLFFFFTHPLDPAAGRETLVIADAPPHYPRIEPDAALIYERNQRDDATTSREDQVFAFTYRERIRSRSVLVRGYDLNHPGRDIAHRSPPGDDERTPDLYEHEGSYEEDHGERPAAVRLEQERREVVIAEGRSFCRRLAPGHVFTLQGHDIPSLDGSWVVTELVHEGQAAELAHSRPIYENRMRCAPADVPVRPPRKLSKPRQTAETAIVVGPPGQEIHTDGYGRVKVQFHWDLEGRHDENSSCWIRVAQAWAGAGWGARFVPRVGMEVVVTFLGGDLDRPLITGCVYNATHPPPEALPLHAARSGIRTQSTPGGEGYNELLFDDEHGKELLRLQAQRNLELQAGLDATTSIGGSATVQVGGALRETVARGVHRDVSGNAESQVSGNRTETTLGNVIRTEHALTEHVEFGANISIGADAAIQIDGDLGLVVGAPGKGKVLGVQVLGDHSLGATGTVVLRATEGLRIECGDSAIVVDPKGVRLEGKSISVAGKESTSLSGAGPALSLGKQAELRADVIRLLAKDAWLKLDKDGAIRGEKIKLNCDDTTMLDGAQAASPGETVPFKLKTSDPDFKPYVGKKFQVLADGLTFEGTTDGDGLVSATIPKAAKTVTVMVWVGDYPTGERRTWTIQRQAMPPGDTVQGAQLRLANLGYYSGQPTKEIDKPTRAAIASFQGDHGLPVNGKLDAATGKKIEQANGS